MTRQALAATKQRKKKKKRGKRSTIKSVADSPKLGPNEQNFVDEYLLDLNGRRAYQSVYPEAKENTARTEAWRFLTNPDIASAIAVRREEMTKQVQVTRAEVVREFVRIGVTATPEDTVKMHHKIDALNSLAKHLGMFPTRVEQGVVQVPVQFNIVIRPTQGQE